MGRATRVIVQRSIRAGPDGGGALDLTSAVLADRVILKHNDVMFVSDLAGDVPAGNDAGLGLYRSDSRFLSTYELRLNGRRPILLNHGVDRAYVATFQLSNPLLQPRHSGTLIPQQSLSLRRTRFMHNGVHERIGLQNCNRHPIEVDLELRFDADFLDIFEVRGYRPERPMGTPEPAVTTETGLKFGYRGMDGVRRSTEIIFSPVPTLLHDRALLTIKLGPQEKFVLLVDLLPIMGDGHLENEFHFDAALNALERQYKAWNLSCTRVTTDNELLDGGLI